MKKYLVLFLSLLMITCAASKPIKKIKYSEILNLVKLARADEASRLLEKYHNQSGPVFRSYFLLATLYQNLNKHKKALIFFDKVNTNERGLEYWALRASSYLELTKVPHKIMKKDIRDTLAHIVDNTSFLAPGLENRVFMLLERFPDSIIKFKLCKKEEISKDPRCSK